MQDYFFLVWRQQDITVLLRSTGDAYILFNLVQSLHEFVQYCFNKHQRLNRCYELLFGQ